MGLGGGDPQTRLYGRDLTIIPVQENNLRQLVKTIDAHPERANWDVVHKPIEGDIALMRQSRHPIHVGIWLDIDGGWMLHCMQRCWGRVSNPAQPGSLRLEN